MRSNLAEAYKQGMQIYDRCHAPTVRSLWDAFYSELSEFFAEPSHDEAWDVLHSFGRLIWRLTGIPLFWLAKPTVEKHGHRFAESGCIRSSRNCLGNCCQKNSDGEKCKKCAMLSAAQAQELHGNDGDRCWNPAVCYSRRSYARHHDHRNLIRSRQRGASDENLVVNIEEFASVYWAVLVVYRQSVTDTPIHVIAIQVRKEQEKFAEIKPIHCAGMVAPQVHTYVQKVLVLLESNYGIKNLFFSFASLPLHPN